MSREAYVSFQGDDAPAYKSLTDSIIEARRLRGEIESGSEAAAAAAAAAEQSRQGAEDAAGVAAEERSGAAEQAESAASSKATAAAAAADAGLSRQQALDAADRAEVAAGVYDEIQTSIVQMAVAYVRAQDRFIDANAFGGQ